MQHAVQLPLAAPAHAQGRRRARAARAIGVVALASLIAVMLACDGAPSPQAGTQQPATPGDSGPQLTTATGAQLVNYAGTQTFSSHVGASDEQMLSTIVNGQRRFGPRATITALRGLDALTMDSLTQRGRPLARIVSDSAYPKLGIKAGTNWLFVQHVGGPPTDSTSWRARMVAADGTDTVLVFNSFEDHPEDPPPATARWLWVPTDEGIWVRCASGCCTIGKK
jgi:hypothetical protein